MGDINLDVVFGVVRDIKEQLDEVDEKCDQLIEFKAVHLEQHKIIESRQANFKKTLYGSDNGTGLTYQVQKLINCKKSLQSSSKRWKGFGMGILKILITAAIIAVATWLLSVYKSE